VVDGLAQVERHPFDEQLARLHFRKIEDVVEDREQGVGRVAYRVQVFTLQRRELGQQRELRHADHPVHGGADLVAHVGQEFTFRPARRFGRIACLAQPGAQALNVASDERKPTEHGSQHQEAIQLELQDDLLRMVDPQGRITGHTCR
jgi:hypothetical protein